MTDSEIRIDTTQDGVEDQIGEDLRLGLLIAAQAAHRLMDRFSERAREREREAREETQRFQAELEAHRAMAAAVTRDAGTDRWWQESSPQQIARAWEVGRVWEGRDDELSARVQAVREGLADRYGITDPDQLTVRDLVAAQRDERAAQLASPLESAEWEARQYGQFAAELRRERQDLAQDVNQDREQPSRPREFVAGQDGTEVHDRAEWAQDRVHALADLERQARHGETEAKERADRLRGHGAKPATDREWATAWDTADRREALRTRLREAGVPADAASSRLLTDRAQGQPPRASVEQRAGQYARQGRRTPQQRVQQQRRTR